MIKTTLQFASIAEARAYFLKKGYMTVESGPDTALMTKHVDGQKLGEVIINREAFMNVTAELISLAEIFCTKCARRREPLYNLSIPTKQGY